MKRKIVLVLIISALLMLVIPVGAFASSKAVKISLPGFNVTLNGVQVDNKYRQYPLIIYKDITYFPMTYYDCRFLGIETKWDRVDGLEIDKTGISGAYRPYQGKVRNGYTYTANIPEFNVKVNGKAINNSEEEYPLLVFRDVTYFPMTWRFGVEEFGWDYKFDSTNGLVIQSANGMLDQGSLPGYKDGPFINAGQYYYYGGSEGEIYQTSVNNLKNPRKVYQLPMWSYGDSYVYYDLIKKDGVAWLSYHQGGAVMGSDYYIKLKDDGTWEEVEVGYLTFRVFGDITVRLDQRGPPGSNNLMVKYPGQEYVRVGSPDYLYGWDYEHGRSSEGGRASGDIYLTGDIIYVLGVNREKDTDASKIYRVNIHTGETICVSNLRANSFKMDDDNIYLISEGKLYKQTIDGVNERQLEVTGPVSLNFDIQVMDGNVYYVNREDNELYQAVTGQSLNPGGKVTGLKLEDGYLISTFEEDNNNHYRIIVFDKSGKEVFKSSDIAKINTISIENNKLVYVESTSKNMYSKELINS
ncbi:hypothetical protein [Desulforamulus aquiferis]|uniref:DUF5050 domain-containing protein n=1 Tax=Desulforamulus aquiferis TaxID=1397668 RepID=A0AAW7Z7U4_9FIRM|nr:hypothetical protein [Desulforamulus aquiferis]MDO7785912.1 hypothetical protein [Desulforamulus aquiferis]